MRGVQVDAHVHRRTAVLAGCLIVEVKLMVTRRFPLATFMGIVNPKGFGAALRASNAGSNDAENRLCFLHTLLGTADIANVRRADEH